jgi:hypothetical protein
MELLEMSDTEFNALPRRARRALKSAARGGEITQALYDSYLTTEEAADYLGLAPN